VPLSPLLTPYDHVLLDLDGCVRVGEHATPRADEACAALRQAGKGVAFVTNDPDRSPEEVVQQLWGLGVRTSLAEVVTVGGAIQHVLAETPDWRTAYVIGAAALHRHVEAAGVRILNGTDLEAHADVVVVAAHRGFDYAELRSATQAVLGGAGLLAAGRDATFPMPDGAWPGTGAVLAAVESASGRRALSVGKPDPQLFRTALDRLGGGRALVVGDRLDADVAGAHALGLDAALVLSGVSSGRGRRGGDGLRAAARGGRRDAGGPRPGAVRRQDDARMPAARRVVLIVNPSAGGGRAARLVPAVEAALAGHGLPPGRSAPAPWSTRGSSRWPPTPRASCP
jgi:HAD superfamily hydrolase (TIGR01450 family)